MTTLLNQHEHFLKELAASIRAHSTLPAFPPGITLEQAYAMLPKVASLACDASVYGLKAGLTNPQLQQLFGLEEALLGLLYDWGECRSGSRLPYREHAKIECELGIVVSADGTPISMGPAIEFVHLNFSSPADLTPANLVVSSLGADRFLCGEQISWAEIDFDSLSETIVCLQRDGQALQEVSALESFGGPVNALEWCICEAKKRDLPLVENTLLLTGTCGEALTAAPGEYIADYGILGEVTFTVDATSA